MHHHGDDSVLRDVTGVNFLYIDQLLLIDGTMLQGSYVTHVDSFSSIMRDKERALKQQLISERIIGDVEDGVTIGVKEALVVGDDDLSDIMKSIMREINATNKAVDDLKDKLRKNQEH